MLVRERCAGVTASGSATAPVDVQVDVDPERLRRQVRTNLCCWLLTACVFNETAIFTRVICFPMIAAVGEASVKTGFLILGGRGDLGLSGGDGGWGKGN